MTSQVSIHALIPAAGVSQRFGADKPKQYAMLRDQPVLAHTIRAFGRHPAVTTVNVVLARNDEYYDSKIRPLFPRVATVTGGQSRAHSVLNGLHHIRSVSGSDGYVLVHDAARPCIEQRHLDELIRAGLECNDGVILAIPVSDTIKLGSRKNRIEKTVDRSHLWQAQTPQMFELGRLIDALEAALAGTQSPTDEASAMEATGAHPRLVTGSTSNIKITTAQDLFIAAGIMSRRSTSENAQEE